jgi:hypothetical protein
MSFFKVAISKEESRRQKIAIISQSFGRIDVSEIEDVDDESLELF